MRIKYLYKDGKKKALTMSYDDCAVHDRRLVEIFNKYHIKGTFHLISERMMHENSDIKLSDIPVLYAGHEVSCHSLTHPFFDQIPKEELLHEMLEDKLTLEKACGYPVRGMSYPNGIITEDVLNCLKVLGFKYGRSTISTNGFKLPADFMQWTPTCHHSGNIIGKIDEFKNAYYALPLFYIWGHSFELPRNTPTSSWEMMEEFCDKFTATFEDTVWYATNIEIYDYVTALRALELSADRTMVLNNSAMSVWLEVDGAPVEIKPGLTHLA